ncbi:MAG: amidohydrolase [Clostridiales bacterium]|nr:amidohydrolase [Clostridiales bacterium]
MDRMEQLILQRIDENRDKIIEFGRDIYTHAELGYKEYRTAGKFVEALKECGIEEIQEGLAVTGVKGYLNGGAEGPTVALIGELDALAIPNHKYAWEETGAAHCCGHHAQMAGIMGAAIGLCDPEIAKELSGRVCFYAVPSEECGEVDFKRSLMDQGIIRYLGGKCELIRIGAFDDIDVNVVHHTITDQKVIFGSATNNGFTAKTVRYKGIATHAAGSPHKGVNALNAAALGISAIQYQRETFQDKDTVRIHPIITKGGDLVNVIPDDVVVETLVRANTMEMVMDADKKADRAFRAGAIAVGAGMELITMPGYLPNIPLKNNNALEKAYDTMKEHCGYELTWVTEKDHGTGSTDVGDLQHIMPTMEFRTGGACGGGHQVNYDICDEDLAYVITAKIFALAAYHLLKDGAAMAKDVKETFNAKLTKEEYLDYMEKTNRVEVIEIDRP